MPCSSCETTCRRRLTHRVLPCGSHLLVRPPQFSFLVVLIQTQSRPFTCHPRSRTQAAKAAKDAAEKVAEVDAGPAAAAAPTPATAAAAATASSAKQLKEAGVEYYRVAVRVCVPLHRLSHTGCE